MFEASVNVIVGQAKDQLDVLKMYVQYRVTFHVERVLNRLKVLDSLIDFPGQFEFNDSVPIDFDVLINAYHDGLKKDSIIKAVQIAITQLNRDIETLTSV